MFAILEEVTGLPLRAVTGTMRPGRPRAPVVPGVTDVRQLGAMTPTAEEAAHLEWRACDAEDAVAALLRFGPAAGVPAAGGRRPDGAEPAPEAAPGAITVSYTGRADAPASWPGSDLRLYGTEGTLLGQGYGTYTVSRYTAGGADARAEALPVPERLGDALPQLGDPLHAKWAALARDFLADIRGEAHQPYLTFRDGWRYQEAIDAIRAGRGWYDLPS